MRVALTIAGSDSGAGAGIQADLKTFAAHGVYGVCAITAITAQNTRAVTAVEVTPLAVIRAQIEAVVSDFEIHAVKTGMLASAAVVGTVAEAVQAFRLSTLVVDPVMVAKSGDTLLDDSALDAMRTVLVPLAAIVTPNLPEAEALTGVAIRSPDDMAEAARRIHALGARAVIVKGGHATGDDIVDVLYDGTSTRRFAQTRVPGRSTHGTGCTFAAALTAHLASGTALSEAVPAAQRYVAEAIRHAPDLGSGHGPMQHFWRLDPAG
jgi:hydroxymethylpyrimidine/phosphomethylpyrimidine kinase